MSVIDNTTLPDVIGISESQYKEFMREIKAMKPNKRKNWKNYLTDKWGTRTRCKYRNGKIYNWSLIANEWQEVIVTDWSQTIPTSRLGRMLKAGIPHERAFNLEIAINQAAMDGN